MEKFEKDIWPKNPAGDDLFLSFDSIWKAMFCWWLRDVFRLMEKVLQLCKVKTNQGKSKPKDFPPANWKLPDPSLKVFSAASYIIVACDEGRHSDLEKRWQGIKMTSIYNRERKRERQPGSLHPQLDVKHSAPKERSICSYQGWINDIVTHWMSK